MARSSLGARALGHNDEAALSARRARDRSEIHPIGQVIICTASLGSARRRTRNGHFKHKDNAAAAFVVVGGGGDKETKSRPPEHVRQASERASNGVGVMHRVVGAGAIYVSAARQFTCRPLS